MLTVFAKSGIIQDFGNVVVLVLRTPQGIPVFSRWRHVLEANSTPLHKCNYQSEKSNKSRLLVSRLTTLQLEISLYWESVSWLHGNGDGNGLMGMVGNETPHFPIYCPQVADHQTLLIYIYSCFFA